jgi:hypothetical protein
VTATADAASAPGARAAASARLPAGGAAAPSCARARSARPLRRAGPPAAALPAAAARPLRVAGAGSAADAAPATGRLPRVHTPEPAGACGGAGCGAPRAPAGPACAAAPLAWPGAPRRARLLARAEARSALSSRAAAPAPPAAAGAAGAAAGAAGARLRLPVPGFPPCAASLRVVLRAAGRSRPAGASAAPAAAGSAAPSRTGVAASSFGASRGAPHGAAAWPRARRAGGAHSSGTRAPAVGSAAAACAALHAAAQPAAPAAAPLAGADPGRLGRAPAGGSACPAAAPAWTFPAHSPRSLRELRSAAGVSCPGRAAPGVARSGLAVSAGHSAAGALLAAATGGELSARAPAWLLRRAPGVQMSASKHACSGAGAEPAAGAARGARKCAAPLTPGTALPGLPQGRAGLGSGPGGPWAASDAAAGELTGGGGGGCSSAVTDGEATAMCSSRPPTVPQAPASPSALPLGDPLAHPTTPCRLPSGDPPERTGAARAAGGGAALIGAGRGSCTTFAPAAPCARGLAAPVRVPATGEAPASGRGLGGSNASGPPPDAAGKLKSLASCPGAAASGT